jgi:hypothetical protein
MKSTKVIAYFKTAFTQMKIAHAKFYCYKLDDIGIKYTDDQRQRMSRADELFQEAETIARGVASEIIGNAVMREF